MSTHTELPYSNHVEDSIRARMQEGWEFFRLISVDGLSPVLVQGRANSTDGKVSRIVVRVVAMPDGRNGYWRTPDARYIRRFASMVATDHGVTLTSERVDYEESLTHWTFRFNVTA